MTDRTAAPSTDAPALTVAWRPTRETSSYTGLQGTLVEAGIELHHLIEREGSEQLRAAYWILQGLIDLLEPGVNAEAEEEFGEASRASLATEAAAAGGERA